MKKIYLLILFPMLMVVGCAKEAGEKLPPISSKSYSVVLDADSSSLSNEDSSSTLTISLKAKEDENVVYKLEIGAPCYLKTLSNGLKEIIVKQGAYFKSISNYKVNRISCDIYEGKGINYEVYNNVDGVGEELERHISIETSIYSEDSGAVYDYQIDANEWSIVNKSIYKPAFYSVTIYFEIE